MQYFHPITFLFCPCRTLTKDDTCRGDRRPPRLALAAVLEPEPDHRMRRTVLADDEDDDGDEHEDDTADDDDEGEKEEDSEQARACELE